MAFVPDYPSIVKSRLLIDDNMNSIVMKLDKVHHFVFVDDKKAFTERGSMTIFRGKVKGKPSRKLFMETYFHYPVCDLGDASKNTADPAEWRMEKKTINEHSDYKFMAALEGVGVASNLKWAMSSNSVAVMPRPTCKTWFMEDTLVPNYHYIEIKPDFSDLEERLNYYIEYIDKSLETIRHTHEYVPQFEGKRGENLISPLVLSEHFKMTGQKS